MERDEFGFDPLAQLFLAFGDEVRQAGSREEPIDHRGRSCQTPAPCYLLPNCWISSESGPTRTSSPSLRNPRPLQLVARCAGSDPAGSIPSIRERSLICPGRASPSPFTCASGGSSATR